MQHVLLLVIALAGSGWDCTESNGLWDCRPARAVAKVPVRPPAPATAATPLAAAIASLPAGPAAAPIEAPSTVSTETPVVVPGEAPAAVPDEAPAAVLPRQGFFVQVGAYRQRADAEQEASRLDYEGLDIVPTERDGESWWVIVLGAFPSFESARSAGAEYEAETGGSYWVRTAGDLQAVRAEPR